ncbi:hypothetical protein HCN44_005434 [Aphidius gifuensis]|uniref:Regulator of microtubule dynamics protein 1 n=1 Tax=Aphidius gifuensis TaxID=684658 RepID=A0A835CV71_APHGI|nr:hypothetical protein HCN44_005434 [Aphidius gifuensis]
MFRRFIFGFRQTKFFQRTVSTQIFLQNKWKKRAIIAPPVASMALWGFNKKDDDNDNVITNKQVLLAKADALYENSEYQNVYDLLKKYKENKDVEILWRLARTLFNMSKTASDVEGKKMIYEAYELIDEALKLKDDHWAVHKWFAVVLDKKNNYEGIKARLNSLYTVKTHLMKASELNPNDATTLYMLGNWCYQVADLAWYQRKIANTIFGKVPESTFDDALIYFEKAEIVDPLFYSHNLLSLGKTYLKLGKKTEAIKYLKMTTDYLARNNDDHAAKVEASKILGTL